MEAEALKSYPPGTSFQIVEIDSLFAYQHIVDLDHVAKQCAGLSAPRTIDTARIAATGMYGDVRPRTESGIIMEHAVMAKMSEATN